LSSNGAESATSAASLKEIAGPIQGHRHKHLGAALGPIKIIGSCSCEKHRANSTASAVFLKEELGPFKTIGIFTQNQR
jgi:hypothetical protein